MSGEGTVPEGKKEACKTYVEQTKLLVTLASAFIVAPAAALALVKQDSLPAFASNYTFCLFLWAEGLFVGSVLAGYVVLGAIAGSQDENKFDVYRKMVIFPSWLQIFLYLLGLWKFSQFLAKIIGLT